MKLLFFAAFFFLTINQARADYPRLAVMAMPGPPFTPQYVEPLSNRPLIRIIPKVVASGSMALSFAPFPTSLIGTGIPISIRLVHVIMNGSLTPGRPVLTAMWVISPYAGHRVQKFRSKR